MYIDILIHEYTCIYIYTYVDVHMHLHLFDYVHI
jgi:hypothetical protein